MSATDEPDVAGTRDRSSTEVWNSCTRNALRRYATALRSSAVAVQTGNVPGAFYGDLFRPLGRCSARLPEYDVSDVDDLFERELLYVWWWEATRSSREFAG